MSRGGKRKDRDGPDRRCIATGISASTAGLVRFVVNPEGRVIPDLTEKLPGRGIWVSADRGALDKAIGKNLFSRAARRSVIADADLTDLVIKGLRNRLCDLISMARKAGQAVAGLEKTKTALVEGQAAFLLQASDGSEREKDRLRPPDGENTYFDGLSAQELGLAFGRDRVIHAALITGGLALRVRYESARLTGLLQNKG